MLFSSVKFEVEDLEKKIPTNESNVQFTSATGFLNYTKITGGK